MKALLALLPVLLASPLAAAGPARPAQLVVLAPASLSDVLPKAASAWRAHGGLPVAFSFDATSRLARQIEQGAPADVFISADEAWMDRLAGEGKLSNETRRDLASTRLAVVVPAASRTKLSKPQDLAKAGLKRLALADENVPAGRYARAALDHFGLWDAVAPSVVRGDNVRTVLRWVAKGDAEAGVVYETDARAERRVATAFLFPDASHEPIVYPAAALARADQPTQAQRFIDFLAGPKGRDIFKSAGFRPAPRR